MYDVAVTSSSDCSTKFWSARLDQRAELVLRLDHERPVPERLGDAAVRGAARHLIGDVEAEPDRELEGQMRPPARQPACLRVPGQVVGFYPGGPLAPTPFGYDTIAESTGGGG